MHEGISEGRAKTSLRPPLGPNSPSRNAASHLISVVTRVLVVDDEPTIGVRTSEEAGAGLGLAIARGLVEAHGGRIWAEPRPEGGTRVSFTLPAPA